MIKWKGIIIHHSASPQGGWRNKNWHPITAHTIRGWHVNERGWSDIGYHFVILSDGRVETGRPLDRIGAHTRASRRNHTAIGVCLIGNFQYDSVKSAQLTGAVNLVKKLIGQWKIPLDNIELHQNVPGANTLCPGRYFPREQFFNMLADRGS